MTRFPANQTTLSSKDQRKALQRCITLITRLADTSAHSTPGVDVNEAASNTVLRLWQEAGDPSFPWPKAEQYATTLWRHALQEEISLLRWRGVSISHDTADRANHALDETQSRGLAPTVDNVYAVGREVAANPKSAPGRESIRHLLDATVELDAHPDDGITRAPIHISTDALGRRGHDDDGPPFTPTFMPTSQTRDDLDRLIAARAANRRDDGGIDCNRLDLLALLTFERKRYGNGTETQFYPDRTQRKLLGKTEDELEGMRAVLSIALATARDEYEESMRARDAYLAEADARWTSARTKLSDPRA